jgi:hypothetical protein
VSAKSIALFEAEKQRRAAPTMPPPPDGDPLSLLEAKLRRQLAKASRAFARAQDLEAQIALLKGKTS